MCEFRDRDGGSCNTIPPVLALRVEVWPTVRVRVGVRPYPKYSLKFK